MMTADIIGLFVEAFYKRSRLSLYPTSSCLRPASHRRQDIGATTAEKLEVASCAVNVHQLFRLLYSFLVFSSFAVALFYPLLPYIFPVKSIIQLGRLHKHNRLPSLSR